MPDQRLCSICAGFRAGGDEVAALLASRAHHLCQLELAVEGVLYAADQVTAQEIPGEGVSDG